MSCLPSPSHHHFLLGGISCPHSQSWVAAAGHHIPAPPVAFRDDHSRDRPQCLAGAETTAVPLGHKIMKWEPLAATF